jgi:hypothetical protein
MNTVRTLVAIGIVTASFGAFAQTANTPGGQASTGSALDQTNKSSEKTLPKTTATSPDETNPSGALTKSHTHKAKTKPTAPGDVPTYPAPAPDGTPTK